MSDSIDLFKLPPKVFISYSHADRTFVEKLAHELIQNRILVWWDEWEIKVGDSLLQKIEAGITSTSYLIVVLSTTSVASAWVQEELRAALTRQLQEKKTIVLPVLLDNCEIPLFLRDKRYADFRTDFDPAFRNLIRAIASPDVGVQGREEVKEYFNDYAIDWLYKDGIFGFTVAITSHSPRLPYSIKASVTAITNKRLSNRFQQYIAAGYPWAIPSMMLVQVGDAIKVKPPIIYISGDDLAKDDFVTASPKHGTKTDIYIEARRLGTDPGDDILYEWGSIFLFLMNKHKEKVQGAISQEEINNFIRWCKDNPTELA